MAAISAIFDFPAQRSSGFRSFLKKKKYTPHGGARFLFEAGANRWPVSRKLIETLVFETCKKRKKKKKKYRHCVHIVWNTSVYD